MRNVCRILILKRGRPFERYYYLHWVASLAEMSDSHSSENSFSFAKSWFVLCESHGNLHNCGISSEGGRLNSHLRPGPPVRFV